MEIRIGDKEILFYEFPDGYTRCEYLESTTGREWIKTGLMRMNEWGYEIKLWQTEKDLYCYTCAVNYCGVPLRNNQYTFGSVSYGFNNSPNVIKHMKYNDVRSIYVNDEFIRSFSSIRNTQYDFRIFTFGYGSDKLYSGNGFTTNTVKNLVGRIYYVKMFDSNKEIDHYFVPCLDNNGEPCMYDIVSKQTFYNQGEGEFNVGYKN